MDHAVRCYLADLGEHVNVAGCPCACHEVEHRPGLRLAGEHPSVSLQDQFDGLTHQLGAEVDRYRATGITDEERRRYPLYQSPDGLRQGNPTGDLRQQRSVRHPPR